MASDSNSPTTNGSFSSAPITENDRFIRIGEAAKMLSVTTVTLRDWEKKGILIPALVHRNKAGRRYRLSDIEALLRSR